MTNKLARLFQGSTLVHNVSAGVVMSENSVALQRVTRARSGRYQCSASNVEGDAISNNITIQIKCKYRPSLRLILCGFGIWVCVIGAVVFGRFGAFSRQNTALYGFPIWDLAFCFIFFFYIFFSYIFSLSSTLECSSACMLLMLPLPSTLIIFCGNSRLVVVVRGIYSRMQRMKSFLHVNKYKNGGILF